MLGQRIILEKLGKILYSSIPIGFDSVLFRVSATVPVGQVTARVARVDGTYVSVLVDEAADRYTDELRANMWREDLGTWFSAEFTVTAAGSLHSTFNYDDEPSWDFPIDPSCYVQDLERFPRSAQHIPEWLRRQVELAGG